MKDFLGIAYTPHYDLGKVLLAPSGTLDGYEGAVSQDMKGRDRSVSGALIPFYHLVPEKRDISVSSAGNALVENQLQRDILKPLTPLSVFLKAGAVVLENALGNVVINRTVTPSMPAWLSENGTTGSTQSPTILSITASPSRCQQSLRISRQLIAQMRIGNGVEAYVKGLFLDALATAVDLAAFQGTGTNQPAGLLTFGANTSGGSDPTLLAPGFTGAATSVSRSQLLGLENSVRNQNVPGPFTWVMSPNTKTALKEVPIISGFPSYLISADNTINGDPVAATTHLPDNYIIGGIFNTAMVIFWRGALEILVDTVTRSDAGEVVIHLTALVTVVFPRLTAFAIGTP